MSAELVGGNCHVSCSERRSHRKPGLPVLTVQTQHEQSNLSWGYVYVIHEPYVNEQRTTRGCIAQARVEIQYGGQGAGQDQKRLQL